MAAVYHRAPVIVPPGQFDFWLDCANVNEQDTRNVTAKLDFTPYPHITKYRDRIQSRPSWKPTFPRMDFVL